MAKLRLKKDYVCGRTIYRIKDPEQQKVWGNIKGTGAKGLSENSLRQLRILGCKFEITD